MGAVEVIAAVLSWLAGPLMVGYVAGSLWWIIRGGRGQ